MQEKIIKIRISPFASLNEITLRQWLSGLLRLLGKSLLETFLKVRSSCQHSNPLIKFYIRKNRKSSQIFMCFLSWCNEKSKTPPNIPAKKIKPEYDQQPDFSQYGGKRNMTKWQHRDTLSKILSPGNCDKWLSFFNK